jgi:hypothetical protein
LERIFCEGGVVRTGSLEDAVEVTTVGIVGEVEVINEVRGGEEGEEEGCGGSEGGSGGLL